MTAAIALQLEELTDRELEVAALVAQAYNNCEIAQRLCITQRTVDAHISSIKAKQRLRNRVHICLWWLYRNQNIVENYNVSPAI